MTAVNTYVAFQSFLCSHMTEELFPRNSLYVLSCKLFSLGIMARMSFCAKEVGSPHHLSGQSVVLSTI